MYTLGGTKLSLESLLLGSTRPFFGVCASNESMLISFQVLRRYVWPGCTSRKVRINGVRWGCRPLRDVFICICGLHFSCGDTMVGCPTVNTGSGPVAVRVPLDKGLFKYWGAGTYTSTILYHSLITSIYSLWVRFFVVLGVLLRL
jgi:hypothetical protein